MVKVLVLEKLISFDFVATELDTLRIRRTAKYTKSQNLFLLVNIFTPAKKMIDDSASIMSKYEMIINSKIRLDQRFYVCLTPYRYNNS